MKCPECHYEPMAYYERTSVDTELVSMKVEWWECPSCNHVVTVEDLEDLKENETK